MEEEYTEHINPPKKKLPIIVIGLILVLAAWLLSMSIVITQENEYKLIKEFGKVDSIVTEAGLSFKIPFIQSVDTLPKQILLYDLATSDVITKDKKTMVADSYVLWKIVDPLKFIQTLNSQILNAENRINTLVYNSMKNVISSLDQSDVISGRDGALSNAIMDNIGTTMDQYGIELITVETKQLDLPNDNKTAVYDRMISERNNIAASFTAEGESVAVKIRTATDNEINVSKSEAKSQAAKIIAEGEAEYMKILSESYKTKERSDFYTFVRSLDAAKLSLKGEKTLILSSDSPLAQIFNHIE